MASANYARPMWLHRYAPKAYTDIHLRNYQTKWGRITKLGVRAFVATQWDPKHDSDRQVFDLKSLYDIRALARQVEEATQVLIDSRSTATKLGVINEKLDEFELALRKMKVTKRRR